MSEPESDFIPFSPYEDISAAYQALSAIDGLNVYDRETAKKVEEIKTMSIDIIHNCLKFIYETFHEEE